MTGIIALALLTLVQTPDRTGPPLSHAWQAWDDAVTSLRRTNPFDQAPEQATAFFREAAADFEEHIREVGGTPNLYRWLGYSYHAAGDLPHAIAAYHRGLAENPADVKVRTALAYARAQVHYPPGAEVLRPKYELWPPWLSLRSIGVYSFGLYVVGCAACTRWLLVRRRRWAVIAAMSLGLAAVPALGSGVEWWRARRDAAEPVVVVSRDVPLRAGNGTDYPPKAELPRGCEVRRLFERGGWLQVETGGGLLGWVPADAVVR